jgi:hypothetical protein
VISKELQSLSILGQDGFPTVASHELTGFAKKKMNQYVDLLNMLGLEGGRKSLQLTDGTIINLTTTRFLNKMQIIVPPKPVIEKKLEIPVPLNEPYTTEEYCLLVEMKVGDADDPTGFAIFVPDKDTKKLKFVSVVTGYEENTQDPLGLIDQTTYRLNWCKEEIIPWETDSPEVKYNRVVEQLKRVDQGYLAYDGDAYIEECTEIVGYSNIWTYEDIPFPVFWESVTPGAPNPQMCGYTWDIYAEYGGPGIADFHDERHLFYRVEVGYNPGVVILWDPREFNQVIIKNQSWNAEGGAMKAIYDYEGSEYNGWWDTVDQTGFMAACGSFIYPNSFTKRKTILNDSLRKWGHIWGSYWNSPEDMPPTAEFPYLTHPEGIYAERSIESPYLRWLSNDGIYVKDRDDLYIYSSVRNTAISNDVGYRYMQRTEYSEDYISQPTDRERILMEGNEAVSSEWKYDYYSGEYYIEKWTESTIPGEVTLTVGEEEYVLFQETALADHTYNDITGNDVLSGHGSDFGIFTKEDTGIKAEIVDGKTINRVDPETVDPIYVFSFAKEIDGAEDEIMYGMWIDGELYKSDFFAPDDSGYWRYIVPEAAGAFDRDNNPLLCSDMVRAGVIRERYRT